MKFPPSLAPREQVALCCEGCHYLDTSPSQFCRVSKRVQRVSGRRCAHHPDVPQGVHKRRDIWPCSGSERNQYPAGYRVCTGQPGQLHSHKSYALLRKPFQLSNRHIQSRTQQMKQMTKNNTNTLMIQTIRRFQFQNLDPSPFILLILLISLKFRKLSSCQGSSVSEGCSMTKSEWLLPTHLSFMEK